MKKIIKNASVVILSAVMLFSGVVNIPQTVHAAQGKITRISGDDRFNTSFEIAKKVKTRDVDCVVLTTGLNYADALSASVLAKKNDAPILLVSQTAKQSRDALTYINKYLNRSGKVYIIGGPGVIDSDFEITLKGLGVTNIERIGGSNRYDTASLIADEVKAPAGTPVVITSGNNFPDALSFSSFAAYNGWPILLVPSEGLPGTIKDFLNTNQPETVYIAGGTGAVANSIENGIKKLVPHARIERFSGNDRFETAGKIVTRFAPSTETIYVATGNNFADALAGSVLAAQTSSPILLIDSSSSSLPTSIKSYLSELDNPDTCIFGGAGAVSISLKSEIENLIEANSSSSKNEESEETDEKDSDPIQTDDDNSKDKDKDKKDDDDDKDDERYDRDSDDFEVIGIE